MILGIGLAVAEPIVVEYRQVIETQIQQDTYIALHRRDTSTSTSTCPTGKELCSASNYPEINTCIPTNSLCCDYTLSVGYCPTTARCGNARFPECAATDSVVVVAPTTTAVTSVSSAAPTASGSGAGAASTGLPTGSIIGISVSVACSVIGLIFGIGFKIWKHKRKEKLGSVAAVA